MPKIVITHSVADIDNWLQFKSERANTIGAMGGSNVADQVAQDGSNTVAVTADVDDVAAVLETISSPPAELGATMQKTRSHPPVDGLRREVVRPLGHLGAYQRCWIMRSP